VRFLVDECLSLELVTVAAEAGYEAHHIAHVGKAGWKDWNVVRHARENNFVLVTNNAAYKLTCEARNLLEGGSDDGPGKVEAPCDTYDGPASRKVV
jgi:hypothetical protein